MQPGHDDLRQTEPADAAQPIGPGRVKAADQLVGQLVGREVDDADEQSVGGQLLHRRTADAVRVKDDRLRVRARASASRIIITALRGVARAS